MIGVTAVASARVYLNRGYIDPGPAMLGVLIGSLIGTHELIIVKTSSLSLIFSLIILPLAIEMIYNALTKRI